MKHLIETKSFMLYYANILMHKAPSTPWFRKGQMYSLALMCGEAVFAF